jgi:predicted nucleic acid-binding protein
LIYVIDASAAVEYLLRTTIGRRLSLSVAAANLVAPELLDVEVLSVVRRAVLTKRLQVKRAREAIDDLASWDIKRVRHAELLERAWALRDNITACDAMYVATAFLYDAALLTCDGPLTRAPNTGVTIQNLSVL